jgi:RNase P subunit RPR2
MEIQFTCEHCGEAVPYAREGLERNHCPYCLWSKHVEIGAETGIGYPPCGGMMRGTDVGGEEVVWRCLGCGFMMRAPTDEYLHRVTDTALGTAYATLYNRRGLPVTVEVGIRAARASLAGPVESRSREGRSRSR